MYIYLHIYIRIYMGFVALSSQSLFMLVVVTFRTENPSLGESFFFPQVRTNRTLVVQTHRPEI